MFSKNSSGSTFYWSASESESIQKYVMPVDAEPIPPTTIIAGINSPRKLVVNQSDR